MKDLDIGSVSCAIGTDVTRIKLKPDGVVKTRSFTDLPCPQCGELCPVEQLDQHVEIIECCNRKFVVAVDGVLTPKFKEQVMPSVEEP